MQKVIVAKRFNDIGSKVLCIDDIDTVNSLFDFLTDVSLSSDVEIVSVKGIENYKEYYPIEEYTDSKKFAIDVLSMMK